MLIQKEILSSLAVILFGAAFLLYNMQYSLDTLANPGPGVFPLIMGAVLVILGFSQLVQDFRKPGDWKEKGLGSIRIKSLRGCLRKDNPGRSVFFMIAFFILYLFMIKWIGFFTSNFLFVIISSRLMGARDWRRPVALSAGINLFCYLLFVLWLKVSFPRGIIF